MPLHMPFHMPLHMPFHMPLHMQSLRCQLESLLDGVLHLSKAILGSDEHRSQHVQVLEHITNLVKKIGKKYSNTSPILTRTTELLQSRYY